MHVYCMYIPSEDDHRHVQSNNVMSFHSMYAIAEFADTAINYLQITCVVSVSHQYSIANMICSEHV